MFDEAPNAAPYATMAEEIPTPDPALQTYRHLSKYIQSGMVPWRHTEKNKTEFLVAPSLLPLSKAAASMRVKYSPNSFRTVTAKQFLRALDVRFSNEICDASVNMLATKNPANSARGVLSTNQTIAFCILSIMLLAALVAFPLAVIISVNVFITIYFMLAILFRAALVFLNAPLGRKQVLDTECPSSELPVITILAPLYKDADALVSLSRSIASLAYPKEKLDVKFLLEADDLETQKEAQRLNLYELGTVVIVPDAAPKTKPKACNYGLHLARGELVVIYDAEDQPEPDQLLKAANAFYCANPSLACVQAKLNYYNASENWLTRGIMAQTPLELNPCTT